jgi:Na+/melibiose symporter-like transporter
MENKDLTGTSDKIKEEPSRKIQVKGDDLTKVNIYSYGIGHYMNDLCASCWFFYLSYYLKDIVKIGKYNAGYVMLAGQIADALATPTVGICSDKTETRIGKRTPWYISGTLLVAVAFTLIFIKVIPDNTEETPTLIYYITCASLFNIGWASVQVSHMALLPQISLNKKNKDMMNRIRTGFTFMAQTLAILISFIVFSLVKDKIYQYETLAICCIAIGSGTSLLFLFLCREITLAKNIPVYLETMRNSLLDQDKSQSIEKIIQSETTKTTDTEKITWTYWLKKPDFYVYMLVYMFVRLSINVTQSVIPFYMEYMLKYPKTEDGGTPIQLSIVLLISTIGSIFNSAFLQSALERRITNPKNNRLLMISIASLFVSIGCVPMFFLDENFRYPIYGLAFFFGIGFSQGLSTVSNLINDVVGSKGAYGAFVYGSYSFSDKLSCGLVLAFFIPIADNENVLKYSMPIFPPASLICAFVIVWLRGEYKEKSNIENDKTEESDKNTAKKSFIDDSRFTFITNERSHLNETKSNKNIV